MSNIIEFSRLLISNLHITARKRHSPAAGATQDYGSLHANRLKTPTFCEYLLLVI
jgi:hypothetical protein